MKDYIFTSLAFLYIPILLHAQQNKDIDTSIKYIQNYYSSFSTGYDSGGKHVVISENYNAIFSDTVFILTFETIDENKVLQKKTVSINLKNVERVEPYGTDVVEILGNDPLIVPLSGKLAFFANTEIHEINIYYEVDEDVERTQIFKTFKKLIEHPKN
jgi:hypothetical protein